MSAGKTGETALPWSTRLWMTLAAPLIRLIAHALLASYRIERVDGEAHLAALLKDRQPMLLCCCAAGISASWYAPAIFCAPVRADCGPAFWSRRRATARWARLRQPIGRVRPERSELSKANAVIRQATIANQARSASDYVLCANTAYRTENQIKSANKRK